MILGIDPSVHHTGLAVVGRGNLLYHGTIPITQFGTTITMLSVYNIKLTAVELAVVEQVGTYRQGKITHAMASVIVNTLTSYLSCDIITVAPSTWRKAILGNGRASKEDAIMYVEAVFGVRLPADEAEAVCIALYGQTLAREGLP